MAVDPRVKQMKATIDRLFPQHPEHVRVTLAMTYVEIGDRVITENWDIKPGAPLRLTPHGIDRGTILSRRLKAARTKAGLSPERVCGATMWSPSKLARIELGEVSITAIEVSFLLNLYGITDEKTRKAYLELAEKDRYQRLHRRRAQ